VTLLVNPALMNSVKVSFFLLILTLGVSLVVALLTRKKLQ
jgi:hypothetical protein